MNLFQIFKFYRFGKKFYTNPLLEASSLGSLQQEISEIKRYDIINFLLEKLGRITSYLEIGLRDPKDNFYNIKSFQKMSVDPGYEKEKNLATFKMTSNEFFQAIQSGEILSMDKRWDIIFIDGSHLASQVYDDILNSLKFLREDGFIVMHDVNPPTEWHARESFEYKLSPARYHWNGTVWKAFVKIRARKDLFACCVDTDWGVGVISKTIPLGEAITLEDGFLFDFGQLNKNRKKLLNLLSFEELKDRVNLYL